MAASAEHQHRDEAIGRHAVRYYVVVPAFVSQLFFAGKQSGHILRKLADESGTLIAKRRKLPKGLTYYTPTPRLCREHSVPKERGERDVRESALDLAIAAGFFCVMDGPRRYRLENTEVVELLKTKVPANVVHVLTEETDCTGPCVLRLYHAVAGPATALRAVHTFFDKTGDDPHLRDWSAAGQYGFGVLCPTADAVIATRRAFSQSDLDKDAVTVIGLGPTAETLHQALRKAKS